MTRMLASVMNVQEAMSLLSVGVDILDIKDPRKGALGAVAPGSVAEIVSVSGPVTTSATIGDLPMQADVISKGLASMKTTGVDILKVGIFDEITGPVINVLCNHAQAGARIVLVLFADRQPVLNIISRLADAGIYGVMLDTAIKTGTSLRTIMNDIALADFVRHGHAAGLLTGLAGSLREEDIVPLLALEPDYLGFRGALCNGGQRQMEIDLDAACRVRALIPAHNLPSHLQRGSKGNSAVVDIIQPSQPVP